MTPPDFPRAPSLSLWTILGTSLLFFLFVAWLATYQIEEVTKVSGTLEPTVGNAPVQFPTGGVIIGLEVAEGQPVKRGDALIQIESLNANDTADSLKQQILVLEAQRVRMAALAAQKLLSDTDFGSLPLDLRTNQRQLWAEEMASYRSSLAVYDSQKASLSLQIREKQAEIAALNRDLTLVTEETTIQNNLAKEGMTSRTQLITLERELESLGARQKALPLSVKQLQEDYRGAASKEQEFIQNHIRDYRKELTRIDEELGVLRAKAASDAKLSSHLTLSSPIDGRVSGLLKRRNGEVVAPNELIMEIIPDNQAFVANLKIPPASVGYLTPGLPTTIVLDAYAQEPRAMLKGSLKELSAASHLDEKGQPFYRASVAIDAKGLALNRGTFALLSGMSLKCQIHTGQRTLLQFIFNSIIKSSTDAFRER
jgi:adhesin transport system membrane fusion protein